VKCLIASSAAALLKIPNNAPDVEISSVAHVLMIGEKKILPAQTGAQEALIQWQAKP